MTVYKGDHEANPSNYRPISIHSVFNRTSEKKKKKKKKTMYARLKSYIEGNKLLFKAQYGFIE